MYKEENSVRGMRDEEEGRRRRMIQMPMQMPSEEAGETDPPSTPIRRH